MGVLLPNSVGVSWTAVILAAGNGVRMNSERPKVLHEVCGLAMLEHVARAVRASGADRLVVVTQASDAASAEFVAAAGPGAAFAVQEEQLGTADAVLCAHDFAKGATRILVVHADTPLVGARSLRQLREAQCESRAAVALLIATGVSTQGLGRVMRGSDGGVEKIVEEADAPDEILAIEEVNSGCYAFDGTWLWDALPKVQPSANGELYLTDLIEIAARQGRRVEAVITDDPLEILGVNDRIQLAQAEREMRSRIRRRWMLAGVTLVDPDTVYIDARAELARDVIVKPNTHILGESRISARCEIGPNSVLVDTEIGEDCRFFWSHAESSRVGRRVRIGPFSRLRPGAVLEDDVYIGNYAEVKGSTIGAETHIGHFSYVGDAIVGKRVNIGAGTVTCNFDGVAKHRTVIGDDAFIGSGSMLVAPVEIGDRARTGAGAVAISDIAADTLAVGVPARPVKQIPVNTDRTQTLPEAGRDDPGGSTRKVDAR